MYATNCMNIKKVSPAHFGAEGCGALFAVGLHPQLLRYRTFSTSKNR